nr:interleukin-10-like [Misgurnus anguillicaudatus]XP_055041159.1 interleukin-10-like [Misgurnus anguillicaudatus]XP_055041160.1 interleukin-10-like [Misgurnus anguillicaudatus]XP_055041162.1 interleukin-10-like [Misgurnus anguillicaudatus]XP_055041163.1 interleukin-10-like [Misgurnus anguillicaudatus]XP_055041164.1 interleukin-10-like [Misgurnus anguillicaudatus]XP_055041165.1 interleukin-10-like [Misgurnus anguillicaudatus]
MNFSGVILSAVLVLLLSLTAQCRKIDCKSVCCTFVEGFPARLKELRSSYKEILKFYDSNDDNDALIDGTVQHNINGPYGCHVVDEILRFYLDTVLPTAVKKNRAHTKTHIDSIGNIFQSLQRDMVKCRKHFSCQKPFEITSFKNSYEKMADTGVNKAMGELDLLFMYIEQFVASKRDKH